MSTERWLPVVGYEDRYEVSDLGRVRATFPWGLRPVPRLIGLHPCVGGYLRAALFEKGGRPRLLRVHRLVLEAFVGPCPARMQARHLDDDPVNNQLANLSWGTPRENCVDRNRNGGTAHGERHGKSKLTDAQAREIQGRLGSARHADLAAAYGVGRGVVADIAIGRRRVA